MINLRKMVLLKLISTNEQQMKHERNNARTSNVIVRNSTPEVFLLKVVQKIFSKFIGKHPCRTVISIKLQSNFIEIALQHGWCLVNLLNIFKTPFKKNTSGRLFLNSASADSLIHTSKKKKKKKERRC